MNSRTSLLSPANEYLQILSLIVDLAILSEQERVEYLMWLDCKYVIPIRYTVMNCYVDTCSTRWMAPLCITILRCNKPIKNSR